MAGIPDISVHADTPAQPATNVGRRMDARRAASGTRPDPAPRFGVDGLPTTRKRPIPPCPGIAPAIFYDRERCPTRNTLAPLLNSWSFLVLTHLSFGTHRYTELRGAIPDISDRMLAKTLKTLVDMNLVDKDRQPGMPPRVDYSLTPVGSDLIPAIEPLMHWALRNQS